MTPVRGMSILHGLVCASRFLHPLRVDYVDAQSPGVNDPAVALEYERAAKLAAADADWVR